MTRERTGYLALAAVCILWGTTYLFIRIALNSIPPIYLIAVRYMISGSILLVVLRASRVAIPQGRPLLLTALCGVICVGVGNCLLAISETIVPSGFAALCYTVAPFWMIFVDALLPGGKRPLPATIMGLAVGLVGVAVLIAPEAITQGWRGAYVWAFILLQISTAGWVTGSLLQKRVKTKTSPIAVGAVQQLAAGLASFVPATLLEHWPAHVTSESLWAVGYLIVFGSIIGFSSYVYSVAYLPIALVSVYTFINPMVAVALGFAILGEHVGSRELAAMAVIFGGIILVRYSERVRA